MREWLVIENSWSRSAFATDVDKVPRGYIPRDAAEALLGPPHDRGRVVHA